VLGAANAAQQRRQHKRKICLRLANVGRCAEQRPLHPLHQLQAELAKGVPCRMTCHIFTEEILWQEAAKYKPAQCNSSIGSRSSWHDRGPLRQ